MSVEAHEQRQIAEAEAIEAMAPEMREMQMNLLQTEAMVEDRDLRLQAMETRLSQVESQINGQPNKKGLLSSTRRKVAAVAGALALGLFAGANIGTAQTTEQESASTGTTVAETTATSGAGAEASTETAPEGSEAGEPARRSGATAKPADKYDLEGATTVNKAVQNLEFSTPKGATSRILNNANDYNGLKVSHDGNKQSALKSFDKNMATVDAAEGWALSVVNSSKYSQDVMNGFEGKDGETARDDSHEGRIKKIASIVSHKDTDFNGRYRLNRTWDNGNINEQTGELGSKRANFNNVRAFQIIPGSNRYEAVYIKLGGGNDANEMVCLNVNRKLKERKPVSRTTTTTVTTPPEKPPVSPPEKTPVTPPEKPPVSPPEKPPVKPPSKPPVTPKVPEKNDKNTSPAGNDRNKGTPDKAGKGQAGQTPGADGFLPHEDRPATPAPKPTPAPLPESGPEPSAPAEMGDVITKPTTPAVPGSGSDKPTPTTDVDIK